VPASASPLRFGLAVLAALVALGRRRHPPAKRAPRRSRAAARPRA
jgi:hypothetical protein